MQCGLREDEDQVVLLRGVGQQQIEDFQQGDGRDVSGLLPEEFVEDAVFAEGADWMNKYLKKS